MDRTWTHHSNAIIHSSVCWMHKQIEKLWPNFHFALPVFSLPHFPAPLSWRKSAQSNRRQSCPGRCLFSVFLFMNTPPPPHTFSSVKHTHGVKGGLGKGPPGPSENNLYLNSFTAKVFRSQLESVFGQEKPQKKGDDGKIQSPQNMRRGSNPSSWAFHWASTLFSILFLWRIGCESAKSDAQLKPYNISRCRWTKNM